MSDPDALASPFLRIPGIRKYVSASEVLGQHLPERARIHMWKQIHLEQALFLISQILTDIEVHAGLSDVPASVVERRWTARLSNRDLRHRLEVSSTFGDKVFAPQILLLAAKEAFLHCPDGPLSETDEGLDLLVRCLLGLGDDDDGPEYTGEVLWGGMDVALASEFIANVHFNRTLWVGRQLVWFDRTWFRDWPKQSVAAKIVGGKPFELFKESTGVELIDFATVAFNLYTQASTHGFVIFPDEFFSTLGLPSQATEHFVSTTSTSLPEMREILRKDSRGASRSRFGFDVFRRFPLVRLSSDRLLMLSPKFVVQRALSEMTFWDVRQHLKSSSAEREAAFHECTRDTLDFEAGEALRRIFLKKRTPVINEERLQKRLASGKKQMPPIVDYAVRSGNTWLLLEVTDRPMPRHVVFANASAAELDLELDRVLTARKAKQLASTINLIKEEYGKRKGQNKQELKFIPLVLTGESALPWTTPVQYRTREKLLSLGYSDEFSSSVALITLKELLMLENAAEQGYDTISLLRSWRFENPAIPLDQHVHGKSISLDSPFWERNQFPHVIDKFAARMRTAGGSD